MFIKSVNWIDKDAQEAEVIVSDGEIDILCFSQPFKKYIGDSLLDPIYCFDTTDIMITDEHNSFTIRDGNTFRYSLCGKLIDKNKKKVILGGLTLCLEDAYLPGDILQKSFIKFSVSRLDLY